MIKQMIDLLNEKHALLLDYEKQTAILLDGEIEAMEQAVDERQKLIEQINVIDGSAATLSEQYTHVVACLQTLKNTIPRDACDFALLPVYEHVQKNFVILNRIKNMEESVAKHIAVCSEQLSDELKRTHTMSKIKQYFDTVENSEDKYRTAPKIKKI